MLSRLSKHVADVGRDALLDVIQELCAILGTQHAGALPDKVAKLQRSCATLPRLGHFVSDVCEVGRPRAGMDMHGTTCLLLVNL